MDQQNFILPSFGEIIITQSPIPTQITLRDKLMITPHSSFLQHSPNLNSYDMKEFRMPFNQPDTGLKRKYKGTKQQKEFNLRSIIQMPMNMVNSFVGMMVSPLYRAVQKLKITNRNKTKASREQTKWSNHAKPVQDRNVKKKKQNHYAMQFSRKKARITPSVNKPIQFPRRRMKQILSPFVNQTTTRFLLSHLGKPSKVINCESQYIFPTCQGLPHPT